MFAYQADFSRRRLLSVGAGLAAAAAIAPKAAFAAPPQAAERRIALYNTHTGESIKTVYWAEGSYLPDGLHAVNRVLRDFRTGDIHPMDPKLMDLLNRVQALTGAEGKTFQIISGYRSPKTNEMLHNASSKSGVATHSMHMDGKATDIRLPGVELGNLRKAAMSLQGGGVGYYPASDFVHMDTGRVRYW